ncbi:hypothetical protein NDU88_005885 [Pleurodeles waltl]|uniref:Uncharacterized protein n=1 Tax=Pleurodeles waltl TaxID=8319 RepID=A0AAV7LMH6_PLEWA|nr:hypothetical protein NDU88_005885 [Pleurodeles waltl]
MGDRRLLQKVLGSCGDPGSDRARRWPPRQGAKEESSRACERLRPAGSRERWTLACGGPPRKSCCPVTGREEQGDPARPQWKEMAPCWECPGTTREGRACWPRGWATGLPLAELAAGGINRGPTSRALDRVLGVCYCARSVTLADGRSGRGAY